MDKELKVRIHININGEIRFWDTLLSREQEEIGKALNDAALRAIGYNPVPDGSKNKNKN